MQVSAPETDGSLSLLPALSALRDISFSIGQMQIRYGWKISYVESVFSLIRSQS